MHRLFCFVFLLGFTLGPNLTGVSSAYANVAALATLEISGENPLDRDFITKSLLKSRSLGVDTAEIENCCVLQLVFQPPFDTNRKNIIARLEELGYTVKDLGWEPQKSDDL